MSSKRVGKEDEVTYVARASHEDMYWSAKKNICANEKIRCETSLVSTQHAAILAHYTYSDANLRLDMGILIGLGDLGGAGRLLFVDVHVAPAVQKAGERMEGEEEEKAEEAARGTVVGRGSLN